MSFDAKGVNVFWWCDSVNGGSEWCGERLSKVKQVGSYCSGCVSFIVMFKKNQEGNLEAMQRILTIELNLL